MNPPSWFGETCPTLADLEAFADARKCPVLYISCQKPTIQLHLDDFKPWFILCPEPFGILARCWGVAHELAHLVAGHQRHDRMFEEHANAWASCALIPKNRILYYANYDVHGFVAYLRKHYQTFSYAKDDRVRALAYRIANHRLKALEEEVA